MLQESFSKDKRNLRSILLSADFVVVGGGISGICAAVSAARAGSSCAWWKSVERGATLDIGCYVTYGQQ